MHAPDRGYEINQVAALTGLSTARLRAWERRYAVVRPRRQSNGYRAYSADQVALLRAFALLVARGERIGDLAEEPREAVVARAAAGKSDDSTLGPFVDAVRALDRDRLEALVTRQLPRKGLAVFAREVVVPLAQLIGDEWALGTLPVAAEHLASEVVVHALKGALRAGRGGGSLLLAACLPGERHEWGVLAALAQAPASGWRVHYLGADLPVAEVLEAAWRLTPRAVALSVSDRDLCARQLPELVALARALPTGTLGIVGGAGAVPHRAALGRAGLLVGERPFLRLLRGGVRA